MTDGQEYDAYLNFTRKFSASRVADVSGGVKISFKAAHRDGNGKLISAQGTIPEPAPLTCPKLSCYLRFLHRCVRYGFLLAYETQRLKYAESHRRVDIPEKYRTGDPAPETIKDALWEIVKLGFRR